MLVIVAFLMMIDIWKNKKDTSRRDAKGSIWNAYINVRELEDKLYFIYEDKSDLEEDIAELYGTMAEEKYENLEYISENTKLGKAVRSLDSDIRNLVCQTESLKSKQKQLENGDESGVTEECTESGNNSEKEVKSVLKNTTVRNPFYLEFVVICYVMMGYVFHVW